MSKKQELLHLLAIAIDASDCVIRESTAKGENWMVEDASTAKAQFERIEELVRSDSLLVSQNNGLGITRALSEWAPDFLYAAGEAVEDFYMRNW